MRFMLLLLAGFLAACPSQRERIITEWRKGADAYCAIIGGLRSMNIRTTLCI
jgi:hypothetical protein